MDVLYSLESPPGTPVSESVVDAVAAITGTERTALAPLRETIDVDGLNALVASDPTVTVSFEYEGYTIVVTHETVLVDDPTEYSAADPDVAL